MHTEIKSEALNVNEAVNTIFQVLTIALVGLFSLAETVSFLAGAV